MSSADVKLLNAVHDALDTGEFDKVAKVTADALKSANPEIRLDAVEALGWFGEEALVELTTCMADADEDVAQAAINHWELGLSEIEDPQARAGMALSAFGVLSKAEALQGVADQFSAAATELIDNEENPARAAEVRLDVVQALADLIEGDSKARREMACEVYQEVTGNRWISIEEAEKYLRDPEGYEEPE